MSSVNPELNASRASLVLPPSERLMRAAVSGLFAFGAYGCSNDDSEGKDHDHDKSAALSDEELKAACSDLVEEAKKSVDLDSTRLRRSRRSVTTWAATSRLPHRAPAKTTAKVLHTAIGARMELRWSSTLVLV